MGVFHLSFLYGRRSIPVIETPKERSPVRVISCDSFVYREEGIMVSSLPVLRFVVDGFILNLHFSCGVVALEVGKVIPGIP